MLKQQVLKTISGVLDIDGYHLDAAVGRIVSIFQT